jgi:peptidoglycan-N-acetylglucosamine deacetylase
MYFIRVPRIVRLFDKSLIWEIPTQEKKIYITFDDGPDQNITPQILEILKTSGARATFFCTGSKAEKLPELINRIRSEGHSLGNHTFNHLDGPRTSTVIYLNDIADSTSLLKTKLFRPPYGRITSQQKKAIKKDYKIVMWSIMPGDFDERITKEICLKRSLKYSREGSIIVFHDNLKASNNVLFTLPRFIEKLKGMDFTFDPITENLIS